MILRSVAIFILLAIPSATAQGSAQARPADRVSPDATHQLHSLFDEEWQYELRTSPETATALGDNRYNDRLSDYSAEFYRHDLEESRKFLARFEALPTEGLDRQDRLSRELMIRNLREQIEGAQFKSWEMSVSQNGGPQIELPDLITITPFNSVKDYENYLSRLRQIPRVFDQVTANLRQGMKDHLMPPRFLLEKVAPQAEDLSQKTGESSPFFGPLEKFPTSISSRDQDRLRKEALSVINRQIIPAYQRFADFMRNDYAPQGRSEPGIWALPDGEKRYRFAVRRMTTTDLTPDQIHEIGLKELHQTEAQMLAVAKKFGFNDLASFNQHIKNDRTLYAASGQQLLELYAKYVREMEPRLPKYFGHLPKAKLVAIRMAPAREKNAVPADYTPGTADGSRPGHINVNEYDPEHRLLLNVEAIAYHEGIPGHHLQISLAQEMGDLPEFRKHAGYTAFVEGWALYSERLAQQMGCYQDPYSEYGRLENEMWRDIRLIIDTGVHAKHWSRDQMVEYFHNYTAMDEPNIQTEVDRYIAWPGQALAYKLGQLEILKLREEAQQKLGSRFDIRTFHDEVLGNGALPLNVLDEQVEGWMSSQSSK
jgi:uncharacterized protein (DUF885 family)